MIQVQSNDTTLDLQSMTPVRQVHGDSPFRAHRLPAKNEIATVRQPEYSDWIFGVLLLGFILVAWTLVFHLKRFTDVVYATFSNRHLSQLSREGNLLRERIAVSIAAVYLLSTSLLIYQVNEFYFHWEHPHLNGYRLFLIIALGVLVFWGIKILVVNLLGIIFKTYQSTHEYLVNLLLFSTPAGLCLLPLLAVTIYLHSSTTLIISLIFIALLFVIRFVKGLLIGAERTRFSYLFLFVYLCTLELLPLVVILKLALLQNAH